MNEEQKEARCAEFRELANKLGWSRDKLAKELGLIRSSVQRIWVGLNTPSERTMRHLKYLYIAYGTGAGADYLILDTAPKTKPPKKLKKPDTLSTLGLDKPDDDDNEQPPPRWEWSGDE